MKLLLTFLCFLFLCSCAHMQKTQTVQHKNKASKRTPAGAESKISGNPDIDYKDMGDNVRCYYFLEQDSEDTYNSYSDSSYAMASAMAAGGLSCIQLRDN